MDKKELYNAITHFLKNHDILSIAVFGSYTRDDEEPKSDIDLIVEFEKRKSLLEIVKIERELSEDLGIKVDLLTPKSISPYLIDSIRKEMEVIYG